MKYTNNAINILTTKTFRGIGKAWIIKNIKGNEDVENILFLINASSKEDRNISIVEFEERKKKIINDIAKLEGTADGLIALGDVDFHPHRGKVKNSEQPVFLFYKGDLSLLKLNNKNITVIGLTNPDDDIEQNERKVVTELVNNGATIVSGLALGCDTIAHKQALELNGKTIAILPSPLNDILPSVNKKLANQIVENNGLLITEYYEDAKSRMELGGRYQERDRLQALFSDGVVLSASYAKNDQGNDSGSRLAMEYALNYSIPRAVIYDHKVNANDPRYDLSRQILAEEKSTIVINKDNLSEAVKKMLSQKSSVKDVSTQQTDLFNFSPDDN